MLYVYGLYVHHRVRLDVHYCDFHRSVKLAMRVKPAKAPRLQTRSNPSELSMNLRGKDDVTTAVTQTDGMWCLLQTAAEA